MPGSVRVPKVTDRRRQGRISAGLLFVEPLLVSSSSSHLLVDGNEVLSKMCPSVAVRTDRDDEFGMVRPAIGEPSHVMYLKVGRTGQSPKGRLTSATLAGTARSATGINFDCSSTLPVDGSDHSG